MNILDYVIIAIFAISAIIGFIKGFIKQMLTIVGVIVVATLTATVQPYVQSWLVNVIASDGTRAIVSMIAAAILLIVAYTILALIIRRLLKKVKIIKVVDKLLGGLIGLAVPYFIFAVVIALLVDTGENFLPTIKGWLNDSLQSSWIVTKVYANNFFGDWIINGIAEKLINNLQPTA